MAHQGAQNQSSTGLALGSSNLSLRTRSGLVLPTAASMVLEDGCDGVSIDPGASVTCSVAFEVEQNEGKRVVFHAPSGAAIEADIPAPFQCNLVTVRGTDVDARINHDDAPHALPVAHHAPDGTYIMVRADFYTDRGWDELVIPASTVLLRQEMFHEVTFGTVTSRMAGTLEITDLEASVKLECASPAPSIEPARDIVYWADVDDELVLERPYEGGVLRRMYRRL